MHKKIEKLVSGSGEEGRGMGKQNGVDTVASNILVMIHFFSWVVGTWVFIT